MKTKNLLMIAIGLLGLTMTSCQKQPTADISTDKTEYTGGETIKLTSKSMEAHSYKWTMPDGQTSSSKDVDYTLPASNPDENLTFKLQVFSKNGKKTDEAQRTVSVKAAKGDVTFWNKYGTYYPIAVAVGNEPVKMIDQDYASSPSNCNANGCANFNLKVGSYPYAADDGVGGTWSGTITIQKDGCLTFELID